MGRGFRAVGLVVLHAFGEVELGWAWIPLLGVGPGAADWVVLRSGGRGAAGGEIRLGWVADFRAVELVVLHAFGEEKHGRVETWLLGVGPVPTGLVVLRSVAEMACLGPGCGR